MPPRSMFVEKHVPVSIHCRSCDLKREEGRGVRKQRENRKSGTRTRNKKKRKNEGMEEKKKTGYKRQKSCVEQETCGRHRRPDRICEDRLRSYVGRENRRKAL